MHPARAIVVAARTNQVEVIRCMVIRRRRRANGSQGMVRVAAILVICKPQTAFCVGCFPLAPVRLYDQKITDVVGRLGGCRRPLIRGSHGIVVDFAHPNAVGKFVLSPKQNHLPVAVALPFRPVPLDLVHVSLGVVISGCLERLPESRDQRMGVACLHSRKIGPAPYSARRTALRRAARPLQPATAEHRGMLLPMLFTCQIGRGSRERNE